MERLTRVRAGIFLILFCMLIGFFAIKLYDLQIVQTGGEVDNTKYFTTVTRVKAARGEILDCNGNVLVSNRASYDLVFNHYVILSASGTNDYLMELVELCREMDVEYYDHFPVSKEAPFEYTLSDYNSTWQGYFQKYLPKMGGGLDSDISAPLLMKKLREIYKIPAAMSDTDARAIIGMRYELDLRGIVGSLPCYVIMEDVSSELLSAVLELNIPGLNTEASTVREYNTKYAAHVLGYVGAMSEKQWEYYKELEGQTYEMDALVGQSGFELAFEEYLHGTDGWRVDEYYADGTLKRQYYRKGTDGVEQKPISGKNVEVTIDLNLQRTAEDSMAELIANLRASAVDGKKVDGADVEGGAVVVMDVRTGKVLACASYPTYDLSTLFDNYGDLMNADLQPLFNRALQAEYPPGSTFKMAMAIAGIHDGYIASNTIIKTQGKYMAYAESDFTPTCLAWTMNGGTHGSIDVTVALQKSCNYFFYDVGDHIGMSVMDATAKGLGLGEATGIELGEKLGMRANAANKALMNPNATGGEDRWYNADQVMAAIGQSIHEYTPMQMCVYASTLANRGIRYKATFLNRVVSSDYRELEYENQPQILSTMQISDDAFHAYTTGMKLVATDGTAAGTFRNYPIPVAAKTGTAQHGLGSQYSDHGAFLCYAPADKPEIAVVVYGEKAGHGTTMGQIAKAILDTYFENPEAGDAVTNENGIS